MASSHSTPGSAFRAAEEPASSRERPLRAQRRILLVEDNPADVTIFQYALKERGSGDLVDVISHGDVAMEFAQREGVFRHDELLPDLIVLDINLPGFDGLQILGAIRKSDTFRDVPVGIYSSSDDPRDKYLAMEMGARFFIQKPMTLEGLESLATTITEVLASRRKAT